jgi:hypothetical protein
VATSGQSRATVHARTLSTICFVRDHLQRSARLARSVLCASRTLSCVQSVWARASVRAARANRCARVPFKGGADARMAAARATRFALISRLQALSSKSPAISGSPVRKYLFKCQVPAETSAMRTNPPPFVRSRSLHFCTKAYASCIPHMAPSNVCPHCGHSTIRIERVITGSVVRLVSFCSGCNAEHGRSRRPMLAARLQPKADRRKRRR